LLIAGFKLGLPWMADAGALTLAIAALVTRVRHLQQ